MGFIKNPCSSFLSTLSPSIDGAEDSVFLVLDAFGDTAVEESSPSGIDLVPNRHSD
jgi:hypothetical protein